jgi:hypothetical protein
MQLKNMKRFSNQIKQLLIGLFQLSLSLFGFDTEYFDYIKEIFALNISVYLKIIYRMSCYLYNFAFCVLLFLFAADGIIVTPIYSITKKRTNCFFFSTSGGYYYGAVCSSQ